LKDDFAWYDDNSTLSILLEGGVMAPREPIERYRLRGVSLQSVLEEVDRLWDRLRSDRGLRADSKDAGIDVSVLPDVPRARAIKIRTEGHGIDGSMVLDVSFASVISGAHIFAYDLWKQVLLPRLKSKFGKDALNSEASKKDATKSRKKTSKRSSAPKKVRATAVRKRSATKKRNHR
jgi:hypothetical protein